MPKLPLFPVLPAASRRVVAGVSVGASVGWHVIPPHVGSALGVADGRGVAVGLGDGSSVGEELVGRAEGAGELVGTWLGRGVGAGVSHAHPVPLGSLVGEYTL